MDEKVTEGVAAGEIPDTELQQLDFQHVPLSADKEIGPEGDNLSLKFSPTLFSGIARSPLPAEVEREIIDVSRRFSRMESRESSPDLTNDDAVRTPFTLFHYCNFNVRAGRKIHANTVVQRSGNVEVKAGRQETIFEGVSTSRSVARLQPLTQQQVIPTEDEPEVEEAPDVANSRALFRQEQSRSLPQDEPDLEKRGPSAVRNDVATEQRPDEDEACSSSSKSRSVSSQSQESFQSTDGACEEVFLGNQVYHRHAGCITSLFFLQTAKSTCAEKFIEAGFHRTPYLCCNITAKENQNIRVNLTVDGKYKIEPDEEQVVSVAHVVKHDYYQVEYRLTPLPDFKTGFLDLKYFYRVGRRKATTLPIRLRPPTEEDRKSSGSSQGCGGCPPVMHFSQSQDKVTAEAYAAHHAQLKSSRRGTKTIIKRKRSSRPSLSIRSGRVEKRKKMQS